MAACAGPDEVAQEDASSAITDAENPDASASIDTAAAIDTAPAIDTASAIDTVSVTDTAATTDTATELDVGVTPPPAGCQSNNECLIYDDGNACNGVFFCDQGLSPPACRINPATLVSCPSGTDSVCAKNTCSPASGDCALVPTATGMPCVDGDPCTVDSACKTGECVAGPGSWCDCKATKDCAALEDGDLCTGTLFCDLVAFPHKCRVVPGSAVQCGSSDDTTCAQNQCQKQTGKCELVAVTDGVPCDDGDKATIGDGCKDGKCGAGV